LRKAQATGRAQDALYECPCCPALSLRQSCIYLSDSLKAMAIDKGLANGTPDTLLPYLAIGYFYFETMSACQNSMKAHAPKLRTDIPNYTNVKPVIQISEVQLAE
jgi:hypothetical protein